MQANATNVLKKAREGRSLLPEFDRDKPGAPARILIGAFKLFPFLPQ
jgi:hypothetical protein